MSLEEYTPIESSEGMGNASEGIKEGVAEAFKEAIRKSSAGVKRTKRDEKKAKKYDFLLANFLVQIIMDKKNDSLLPIIFKSMDAGYSSNFILGILSLINIDISNKIRTISEKKIIDFSYEGKEQQEFNDAHLPPEVKKRINLWIEDIIDATTIEYSNIQAQKNKKKVEENFQVIVKLSAQVFTFFLYKINITIPKNKALSISEFIIGEVKKAIQKIEITQI